ncbi:MAG: 50S ribosomal protein L11 methyltransferase, partial [Rubrobacter sp.]|nr:50S ribosomal protein L11 methyltransferase [Rubrobacter sp.]
AKLGAGEVLALDVEAAAVAVAQETVSLNGLAGVVEVGWGSVGSAIPPYDVVAANIFPNVLAELAPNLAAAVRGGGVLVTSGSVVARAEEAADAVRAAVQENVVPVILPGNYPVTVQVSASMYKTKPPPFCT